MIFFLDVPISDMLLRKHILGFFLVEVK